MVPLSIVLSVVLLAVASTFDYDPEVETMILTQRKHWMDAKHKNKFAHGGHNQKDLDFFDKLTSRTRAKHNKHKRGKQKGKRAVVGIRAEYRCLSNSDRNAYHSALQNMKRNMVGSFSEYDNFVARHSSNQAISGHFGPSFVAWHREYLATMERAIKTYCPDCMLPYWDSRLDKRLGGNPANSIMFSPLTFGNAVGPVTTGFAAGWTSASEECLNIAPTLKRNMKTTSASFYDDKDVAYLDGVKNHEGIAFPWSTQFEFSHGYVHNAFGTGSHMSDLMCSPSDPIFISHHCFIDLLFEKARKSMIRNNGLNYVNTTNIPAGYDDSDGHISVECAAKSPMFPFPDLENDDGLLSDFYTNEMYSYEMSPGDVVCNVDTDCCANGNSEMIWCNVNTKKCVSKNQESTRIPAGLPANACHCSGGRVGFIKMGSCRCR